MESYPDRRIHSVRSASNLTAEAPDMFRCIGRVDLRKLFSTFPGKWPGVGLLLVRALVGCSLIVQGISYVQKLNESLMARGLAVLAFIGGTFLLAGLMTPLVAVLVAAGGIGVALSWLPLPSETLFDGYLAITNLVVLSIAIALLGPGAFSLDARMFGRREIIIPASKNVSRP